MENAIAIGILCVLASLREIKLETIKKFTYCDRHTERKSDRTIFKDNEGKAIALSKN